MEFRRPFQNSGTNVPANTADYIIFGEDTNGDGIADIIYAKNGKTGEVEFKSDDASEVIQKVLDSLSPDRHWFNMVYINGLFKLSSEINIPNWTILIFDGGIIPSNGNYSLVIEGETRGDAHDILIYFPRIYAEVNDGNGIYIKNAYRVEIIRPHITVNTGVGIRIDSSNQIWIKGGNIYGTSKGVGTGIILGSNSVNAIKIEMETIGKLEYGITIGDYTGANEAIYISSVIANCTKAINIINAKSLLIENSYFELDDYAIYIDNDGSAWVPSEITILGCFFTLPSTAYNLYITNYCFNLELDGKKNTLGGGSYYISPIASKYVKGITKDGFRSSNSGIITFTGDGTTTTFSVAHGLITTPSKYFMQPLNDLASTFSTITADATYIYVNFSTAPPSGSTLSYYWYAEV